MTFSNLNLTLLLLSLSNSFFAQEFMHWKNLDGEKTERVKTKTVWQHPCSANSPLKNRTFFSFEKRDIAGRVEALRMYSSDTTFFLYDSAGIERTVRSHEKGKIESREIIKYSKTGKIIYECKAGESGYERFYEYDSLDREYKMIIPAVKNEFYRHDTLINYRINAKNGKDSVRRHYEGRKLSRELFFEYDGRMNCITYISCDYSRIHPCDIIRTVYNSNNKKIYSLQTYYLGNDTVQKTEESKYAYDKSGRMIRAEDEVSICYWKYNSRGYVIEAKRYDKPGELRFFGTYEYTFWKKKEYRKFKKRN